MSAGLDEERLGALYAHARSAEDAGDIAAAATLFRACLAIDPDDHCGVTLRLAAHGLAAPSAAPPAYVATLFSQQAAAFDHILVERLGYDVPALMRRALEAHVTPPVRALDLGCGTGLVGLALSGLTGHLTGVDLAEAMLEEADGRGAYDDLYVAEAVSFLHEWDEAPFDLVAAADVWPYLGDLAPFLAGAARCLRPGGLLAASSERCDDGWTVTPTQRFAHATDYLAGRLDAHGFDVLSIEPITVRHEEGRPVAGDLAVARRR